MSGATRLAEIRVANMQIQGLILAIELNGATDGFCVLLRDANTGLINTLIDGVVNTGSAGGYGVWCDTSASSSGTRLLINTIIRNTDLVGVITSGVGPTYVLSNNTVSNSGTTGISMVAGSVPLIQNVISVDNVGSDFSGTANATSTNNTPA